MCSWPSGVSICTTLPLAVTQNLRKLSLVPEVKVNAQVMVAASLTGRICAALFSARSAAACCRCSPAASDVAATLRVHRASKVNPSRNLFIEISVHLLEKTVERVCGGVGSRLVGRLNARAGPTRSRAQRPRPHVYVGRRGPKYFIAGSEMNETGRIIRGNAMTDRRGAAVVAALWMAVVVIAIAPHAIGVAAQGSSALPADVTWILSDKAQFPADQLAALRRGQVIARTETSSSDFEAWAVAAV